MLDMLVDFAEGVNADEVTIQVNKSQDAVFLRSGKAPGIIFKISSLKRSAGGILNDMTALRVLNEQLTK